MSYPNILFSTAGIHPHNAKDYSEEIHKELEKILNFKHVVAVGECGLDFNRNFSTQAEQYYAFEKHLELATITNKPLFLHERDAHHSFIQIMNNHSKLISRSVVHCFTSNKSHLKAYLDAGFYIGITGWVCDEKRGTELREALKYLPLDRLMLETDSPFLKPNFLTKETNNRRNEPQFLPYIAKSIANIKNISVDDLVSITTKTTKNFFDI